MPSGNLVMTVRGPRNLSGLDTSSDPTTLDPGALIVAKNIEYLEGAQRKKRLGEVRFNSTSTAVGSTGPLVGSTGQLVRAVADFWRYGSAATPTQSILAIAGTSVFASTGNGIFTSLTPSSSYGTATNTATNVTIAGDYAVISDGTNTPATYDQTTFSSTGLGAAPIFGPASYHLRRLFYGGLSTDTSGVKYTAAGNIFDSTGTDSGSFPVATGDGDAVIGISKSFFGELFVFKGPNYGSIHRLDGLTPTTFTLTPVVQGFPAVNHKVIVTTDQDVYWMSRYGIHSLQQTQKFGNVEAAFISLPIQATFRNDLKQSSLTESFGFWLPSRNIVGWIVTQASGSKNWILCYNYSLSKIYNKPYWSIWQYDSHDIASAAVVITPAGDTVTPNQPQLFLGGNDGFVYKAGQPTLADGDGNAAISAQIRTPFISDFQTGQGTVPSYQEKIIQGVISYFNPKGNYSATLQIVGDTNSLTTSVSMAGGGATLT